MSLAVRGFPFLAPGSRFLVSWNTSRFSDLLSDVIFGFSKFIDFQFLRPLKKKKKSKLEVFRCNSHEGDRKTCLTYFTYILSHQSETWYPKPNTTFPLSPHVQSVREFKTVLDSGFRAMDFGFQSLLVEIGFWIPFARGFWIPRAELWIPKPRINSGFHKHNFHGFQISEFGFLSMGRSLEEVPLMAPLPSVNLSVNDCKLLH